MNDPWGGEGIVIKYTPLVIQVSADRGGGGLAKVSADTLKKLIIYMSPSKITKAMIQYVHIDLMTGFIQCPQGPTYPGVCPLINDRNSATVQG